MRPGVTIIGGLILIGIFTVLFSVNRQFTSPERGEEVIIGPTSNDPMDATNPFSLSSSAFSGSGSIPPQYTCDGTQASPPLSISGAPEGTKSFAIIMEDPDVPKQLKPDGTFLHWVVFNIPASITEIVEGVSVGVQGANGTGKNGYVGPCPPAQYQPNEHRYVFNLYALDTTLPLLPGASKSNILKAMQGHVLGETQLIGRYKRK